MVLLLLPHLLLLLLLLVMLLQDVQRVRVGMMMMRVVVGMVRVMPVGLGEIDGADGGLRIEAHADSGGGGHGVG